MAARILERGVGIDVKLGQAEEDDARALLKADFDERIHSIVSGYDGVHASAAPDPLPVRIGEVIRLRALAHRYRAPDQCFGFLHP